MAQGREREREKKKARREGRETLFGTKRRE
jgi:hypothetical protein